MATSSKRRIRNANRIGNNALTMDFARLIRANRHNLQKTEHEEAILNNKGLSLSNFFNAPQDTAQRRKNKMLAG